MTRNPLRDDLESLTNAFFLKFSVNSKIGKITGVMKGRHCAHCLSIFHHSIFGLNELLATWRPFEFNNIPFWVRQIDGWAITFCAVALSRGAGMDAICG
jgi:hypothetical protein